ncbi:hypothetical protein GJ744_010294 [Endocarpon pusillum]|uniref:Uncharacterized protein n=1 Tax=Endocarpon pusillum TaxID=364733 RepID=A0A8H7E1Z9_9EURO|nr:hypothetical protein GJ744_010294 [Endocarpon pusillum]
MPSAPHNGSSPFAGGVQRKRRRENEERAKVLGFSSYEELKHIETERINRGVALYHEAMDREAARLGKTRLELELEDPQRYVPDSWQPECSCDGQYFISNRDGSFLTKF